MALPRSIEELVEHQVRRWQVEANMRSQGRNPPCIALSRLPGSGAAELGKRVAERLNFGFFGIEIVDQIAERSGIQRELVASLDEHLRSTIDRWVVDAFRTRTFTESDYLRQVVRTVATLGQQGMAVILGRGSPFILTPDRALRVLVVAPRALRKERLSKREGLSPSQAADRLDREDSDRREFNRYHFGVDADDATHYDLVVNTGSLGIDSAVELVLEAMRQRFPLRRFEGALRSRSD